MFWCIPRQGRYSQTCGRFGRGATVPRGIARRADQNGNRLSYLHWPSTTIVIINALCDIEWSDRYEEAIKDWGFSDEILFDLYVYTDDAGNTVCHDDPNDVNLQQTPGKIIVYHHAFYDSEIPEGLENAYGWASQMYSEATSEMESVVIAINDNMFQGPDDSYAYRQMVMCQEIGHALGLPERNEEHTDVNLGSCIDYSNSPQGGGSFGPSDLLPGLVDFLDLRQIYGSEFNRRRLRGANVRFMESESQQVGRILVDEERSIYIQQDSMDRNSAPRRILADGREGKKHKLDFGELTCFSNTRALYTKTLQDGSTIETVFLKAI